MERCFAPSLLTRRLSAALAPDRGTGASSPLRGAPSWEPHLACLLFAGWFYCLPPFGARRSAGHGAGARRIPVKQMETPHVPARVRAALCGRCRTRASAGRPRATCGLPGPRAGEDSTGDGCIVSSHLMTPLSFRRGGRPPCPQRNFPVSPAATASPGGPPPVAAWARALPAAGAHGRREEAAGQRRRHPAHPASPHQGGWEGPSALGVSYPPLPARGSHR